jgi:hypothetical protein
MNNKPLSRLMWCGVKPHISAMKHFISNVVMILCHTVLWHRLPKYGTDNLKAKPLTAVDQHTACLQETGAGHAKNFSDT